MYTSLFLYLVVTAVTLWHAQPPAARTQQQPSTPNMFFLSFLAFLSPQYAALVLAQHRQRYLAHAPKHALNA
jgi:hypothetical protein